MGNGLGRLKNQARDKAMKRNIFCSRKGGVTRKGKFYPSKRVSEILADQIERQANKMAHRRQKRAMSLQNLKQSNN